MGVDRTDYIVYGWELPKEIVDTIDFCDEELDSKIEASPYRLIRDSMCDTYTVFGKVLLSGGDEDVGWEFKEIKPNEIPEETLMKDFENFFGVYPPEKPKTFIFTRFY